MSAIEGTPEQALAQVEPVEIETTEQLSDKLVRAARVAGLIVALVVGVEMAHALGLPYGSP